MPVFLFRLAGLGRRQTIACFVHLSPPLAWIVVVAFVAASAGIVAVVVVATFLLAVLASFVAAVALAVVASSWSGVLDSGSLLVVLISYFSVRTWTTQMS